jgi:hypothetical protein
MIAATLTACVPNPSSNRPPSSPPPNTTNPSNITALSVNPNGALACIAGGRVSVLENGRWTALPAPASVSSVVWRGDAWWLAMPQTGLVLKATGVPETISFTQRPAFLSSRFVFTLEGDVYDYAKVRIGRIDKLPKSVLETGDTTFALVDNTVYAIGKTIERRQTLSSGTYSLVPANDGIEALPGIAARADGYTYKLEGDALVALNTAARETARVTVNAQPSSMAAGRGFVAVTLGSRLRVLRAGDLFPVFDGACGGGA